MITDAITATTIVAADPLRAFDLFTAGIGEWWKPKVHLFRRGRSGVLQFSDGRLVETYPDGEPFEVGHVLAWEPGRRLVLEWRQESFAPEERTEVEVRFDSVPKGTRVTVVHRGWDSLPATHPARYGYSGGAFTSIIGLRWGNALTGFRAAVSRLE